MASTPATEGITRFVGDLSTRLGPVGFVHAKKMLWVRVENGVAHFIHLHRDGSSYGPPIDASVSFRIHLGVRMLEDTGSALHLNGPASNEAAHRHARYHLRFNARTWSMYERTLDDAERFVRDVGGAWFDRAENRRSVVSGIEISDQSHKLLGSVLGKPASATGRVSGTEADPG